MPAGAHFLDVVAAEEQAGDEGIAADATGAKFLGFESRGQAAGIVDLDSVVKEFDGDLGTLFQIVPVPSSPPRPKLCPMKPAGRASESTKVIE